MFDTAQPPWEPQTAYPPELQRSSVRLGGGSESLSETASRLPRRSGQEQREGANEERRGSDDLSGSEEDLRRRFAASRLARINSLIRDRAGSECASIDDLRTRTELLQRTPQGVPMADR